MDDPLPAIAVGGGPAGAAFAIELARNGRRVQVLESTGAAHHKVCGEFLSAETQALVEYLGVHLAAAGAASIATLRLASGTRCAEAPLPFQGAGLSRHRLDETLLQAAAKAGAEVLRVTTVSQIEPGEGRVVVRARTGHQPRAFQASVVALATGKHGVRQYPRARGQMVGFKLHLRLGPAAMRQLDGVVQLVLFEGGYLGACAVEGGLVPVCWVVRRERLKRMGASWQEQAAYICARSATFAALLAGARCEWEKPVAVAGIPYGYVRRAMIAPSVFPLGDQLAVIPSFTGDGMAIALYSGIAAARTVLEGAGAGAFQAKMLARLRTQLRWAGAVNKVFEIGRLQGPGVMLAAQLPGVVTWLAHSTRLRGFCDVLADQAPSQGIR